MSLMSLYEIKSDAADANSQKFQRKMVVQSILGGILPDLCGNLTMEKLNSSLLSYNLEENCPSLIVIF